MERERERRETDQRLSFWWLNAAFEYKVCVLDSLFTGRENADLGFRIPVGFAKTPDILCGVCLLISSAR